MLGRSPGGKAGPVATSSKGSSTSTSKPKPKPTNTILNFLNRAARPAPTASSASLGEPSAGNAPTTRSESEEIAGEKQAAGKGNEGVRDCKGLAYSVWASSPSPSPLISLVAALHCARDKRGGCATLSRYPRIFFHAPESCSVRVRRSWATQKWVVSGRQGCTYTKHVTNKAPRPTKAFLNFF